MSEFIETIIVGGKELREYLETRIADYKVPERILFTLELPKGATGKIHRLSLKSMVPEFAQ